MHVGVRGGGHGAKAEHVFTVETEYVLCSTVAQEKVRLHVVVMFWGSLLHNLRLSAVANFLFLATPKQ